MSTRPAILLLLFSSVGCARLEDWLPTAMPRPWVAEAERKHREIEGESRAIATGTADERATARERLIDLGAEARPDLYERARWGFPEQAIPALNVLAERPDPEVMSFVGRILATHRDVAVRARAAQLIGMYDDGANFAALAGGLKRDPAVTVRVECARAMGNLRHPASLTPLVDAIDDPHFDVTLAAHRALESLTRAKAPEMPRPPDAFRAAAREFWRGQRNTE